MKPHDRIAELTRERLGSRGARPESLEFQLLERIGAIVDYLDEQAVAPESMGRRCELICDWLDLMPPSSRRTMLALLAERYDASGKRGCER